MGGEGESCGFSKKLMLLVELLDVVGEVGIWLCRRVGIGELGEWRRSCAM